MKKERTKYLNSKLKKVMAGGYMGLEAVTYQMQLKEKQKMIILDHLKEARLKELIMQTQRQSGNSPSDRSDIKITQLKYLIMRQLRN